MRKNGKMRQGEQNASEIARRKLHWEKGKGRQGQEGKGKRGEEKAYGFERREVIREREEEGKGNGRQGDVKGSELFFYLQQQEIHKDTTKRG